MILLIIMAVQVYVYQYGNMALILHYKVNLTFLPSVWLLPLQI